MESMKWYERLAVALNHAKKKGKTIENIAYALGVNQGTVSNWKAGRREPSFQKMKEICAELNISQSYIMFGEAPDIAMSGNESQLIESFRHISSTQQKSIADILRGMVTELSENERELLEKFEKLSAVNQGFLMRMSETLIQQQFDQEGADENKLVLKYS